MDFEANPQKGNMITSGTRCKKSIDPRKYKLTNSLCLGYPQNFNPSKLTTLTVVEVSMYEGKIYILADYLFKSSVRFVIFYSIIPLC